MNLPDIEVVSAKVHAEWMVLKTLQGVTSRKAEDGEELMVPYHFAFREGQRTGSEHCAYGLCGD